MAFLNLFGTLGYGHASIQFLETQNQKGIIKTTTISLDAVRAGLAMVTSIAGIPAVVHSTHASGTLDSIPKTHLVKGG